MRIGVLEWNAAILGGRQRTMMCFADAAKELGHTVRVYTNFLEKDFCHLHPVPGYTTETFLGWFGLACLTRDDVCLFDLQRTYAPGGEPQEWHDLDVMIVPYGGYGYLQGLLPGVRVISWVIHPDQNRCPGVPYEVWTNSNTTALRLALCEKWRAEKNVRVVVPPHDYSLFRGASRPWHGRSNEVAIVGLLHPDKGIAEAVELCHAIGANCFVAGHVCKAMEMDNADMLTWLAKRGAQYRTNLTRSGMADLLGDSKVLLIMSQAESCPLIVYEALNAGAVVVARGVGAIGEQVGLTGHVFSHDTTAADWLRRALSAPPLLGIQLEMEHRGRAADRTTTLPGFKVALENRS